LVDAEGLMSRRIGEVVGTASASFNAQCYQLYVCPPLGSFVRTDSPSVFGVVSRVITEPLDSSRPVLARGQAASTEDEVFRNNPQLSRLLTTRFEAIITGHLSDGIWQQFLPPLPPAVHSFVYVCSAEEVSRFTANLGFLSLVLNSGVPVADEVAGACMRAAAVAWPDGPAFLGRAGKALAGELANDLPRLNSVLRRVAP
jgi:hypothetical protein